MDYDVSDRGATTLIAVVMAASGQSVFQIMLKFNTLISLAYGPPALLGWWCGDAAVVGIGFVLDRTGSGMLGAFVYHWSLIQQVPSLFRHLWGVFLEYAAGPRRHAGAGALVQELKHSIDVAKELKIPKISRPRYSAFSAGRFRSLAC